MIWLKEGEKIITSNEIVRIDNKERLEELRKCLDSLTIFTDKNFLFTDVVLVKKDYKSPNGTYDYGKFATSKLIDDASGYSVICNHKNRNILLVDTIMNILNNEEQSLNLNEFLTKEDYELIYKLIKLDDKELVMALIKKINLNFYCLINYILRNVEFKESARYDLTELNLLSWQLKKCKLKTTEIDEIMGKEREASENTKVLSLVKKINSI